MNSSDQVSSQVQDLSADEVLLGILDYGLFADRIPDCFTSVGLSSASEGTLAGVVNETNEKELRKHLGSRRHDYVRYQAMRDINVPRHLGIPHPESYALQAFAIKKHWDQINSHNKSKTQKVSRIHVRHINKTRIFEMNYKGYERFILEETDLSWLAGSQFVVRADISACFPSIYTHSIPWALHGREEAKAKRKVVELSGNLLDHCTQITRDGQTNGLLIGPHASNIISEIVLTDIDSAMLSKGYTKLRRHVDDYEFYASTYNEAERFIRDLGMALREYELTINEKKTDIFKLPRPEREDWVNELHRFHFPNGEEIRFSTVRMFLDLALELSQIANKSTPLNYAIKMMERVRLNERAKRLYVQETINLALYYPYLVPLLDENVFRSHRCDDLEGRINALVSNLIPLGVKKLYPDAIAHGLYYALKYNIKVDIDESVFQEIIVIDDCLVNVLLLEYAERQKLEEVKKAITERSKRLKESPSSSSDSNDNPKRDQDRQWLLIYQTWSSGELVDLGQEFLGALKKSRFNFIKI